MIAVDAMGGDYAPHAVVEGALRAAKKGIPVTLYGNKGVLVLLLDRLKGSWKRLPITIEHCSEMIGMEDEPVRSIIKKKDSSLIRAVRAVVNSDSQAVVSAGNSGAALAAGMMILGKIPGLSRPAIGGFIPTRNDSAFCVDLGANVDCKPEYLQHFAYLGQTYVQLYKGIEKPRIALLCNGVEARKGSQVVQQAHDLLLQSSLNFVGNCEPSDIFNDVADVIVCEGFAGNIMLKSMEATVQTVTQWVKSECQRSMLGQGIGLLARPVFRRLKKSLTRAQKGGALLLGIQKPLIIAHGASDAQAIEDAITFAHEICTTSFYERFVHHVTELLAPRSIPAPPESDSELDQENTSF